MFSKLLMWLLAIVIVVPVWAENDSNSTRSTRSSWLDRYGLTKEWTPRKAVVSIRDGDGREYGEKRGEKTEPRLAIDTVRFSGAFATLELNRVIQRNKIRLTPMSSGDIHVLGITGRMEDTTKTPATYRWKINDELNELTIKSSNANDSALVEVWFMVQ